MKPLHSAFLKYHCQLKAGRKDVIKRVRVDGDRQCDSCHVTLRPRFMSRDVSLPTCLAWGMRWTLMAKSFIVRGCWMNICCYRSADTDNARKTVFWLISFLVWNPSRTILILDWMCVDA